MKKIFLLIAATCAMTACEPEQEDISNGGHITLEQLKDMTSVYLDKSSDGKFGNVVTCETSAPVNAVWEIRGKQFVGNYATKKMSAADLDVERIVKLSALCPDGTLLEAEWPITVQTLTDPLQQYYIYDGPDFTVTASGDASETRFSDNEGKHFPFIADSIYKAMETLIFEIKDIQPADVGIWGEPAGNPMLRVMNGWWSSVYADEIVIDEAGMWELPITKDIFKECASSKVGGDGKDLNLLVRRGTITFGKVFYEK